MLGRMPPTSKVAATTSVPATGDTGSRFGLSKSVRQRAISTVGALGNRAVNPFVFVSQSNSPESPGSEMSVVRIGSKCSGVTNPALAVFPDQSSGMAYKVSLVDVRQIRLTGEAILTLLQGVPQGGPIMQYGLPFQAVFRSTDPRIRNKLMTGTLYVLISMVLSVVLVGLVGFFIMGGYVLRLLRNVRTQQEHPLPEWDQWQTDLRNGFFMFVAYLVWLLPFLVVYVVVLVGNNQEALPATDSLDSFGAAFSYSLGAIGIGFGRSLVALLPTVAGWILGPAIAIALAQRMELADAFKFGNVLAWVARNWVQCLLVSLIAGLMSVLISVVAALTGALALGIGLIVTLPFGFLMSSIYQHHLFGQLAQTRDLTVMFPELANPG